MRVAFVLDGAPAELEVRADEMLVDAMRAAGRLSVRETCGIGVCGACTVVVDDEPVSACLMLAAQVEGRRVVTVEGLPDDDPVLQAFTQAHAAQCGWCTPGMVLTVKAMLADNPRLDRQRAAEGLGGNLCRCGSYSRILDAAELAAELTRADGDDEVLDLTAAGREAVLRRAAPAAAGLAALLVLLGLRRRRR